MCVMEHADHRMVVKPCSKKDINTYSTKLKDCLAKMREDICERVDLGLSSL